MNDVGGMLPQRQDVKAGLEAIGRAASPPTDWPDLSNAIHRVIDDTWWDQRPPSETIGTILRDEREAESIADAVQKALVVLDALGPTEPDVAYTDHPAWPAARTSCQVAFELLAANDRGAGLRR